MNTDTSGSEFERCGLGGTARNEANAEHFTVQSAAPQPGLGRHGRRTLSVVIGLAIALGSFAPKARAHGWCGGFWPLWGFGLGLGVGTALSYSYNHPVYYYGYYSYPAYSYPVCAPSAPTAYPAQANYTPVPTPAVSNPPTPRPDPVELPSTHGNGKWVPDPTPYRYPPAPVSNLAIPANSNVVVTQRVSFTTSPGGVVVYILSR